MRDPLWSRFAEVTHADAKQAQLCCCTLVRNRQACFGIPWQARMRNTTAAEVHCCQTAPTLARLSDSCTWQAESQTMPGLSWSVPDIFRGIFPQGTSVPRRGQSGPWGREVDLVTHLLLPIGYSCLAVSLRTQSPPFRCVLECLPLCPGMTRVSSVLPAVAGNYLVNVLLQRPLSICKRVSCCTHIVQKFLHYI